MAVAGLHNVPDFPRPFFSESQRRDSGRWDADNSSRSTRASALLQMWREIEGENVLSQSYRSRQHRNGFASDCRSASTSLGDGSENGDTFSQVSNESGNQGFSGSEITDMSEDNNSVISMQSDLGEIERDRVRQIFQEWMNSCPKGHPSSGFKRKNRSGHWVDDIESERVRILRERAQITTQQSSDCASFRGGAGPQIEQVCYGALRKPLRRICGRLTLLDLLLKAHDERKRELRSIAEQRLVSDFAHRNRIQALLRGRFLRNGRVVMDLKPSSVAATELGVLWQRQTVSDLREGFLSKLDISVSASVNSTGSDSSTSDGNRGGSESTGTKNHISADLEGMTADGNRNIQEHGVQIKETEKPVLILNEGRKDLPVCSKSPSRVEEESALARVERGRINITSLLESVDITCSGPSEVYNGNNESVSSAHEVYDHTNLEGNTNEEFDADGASVRTGESPALETENEQIIWHNVDTVVYSERDNVSRQERSSSQSLSEPSGNNVEEQDQIQESHDWPSHDVQETIDSWLDMPTSEAGESVREVDTVYFPYDDDKGNSMELRELFSRRRVSSLLHSSFRESLNQVLQSHAERLGRASVDWESDSASFPSVIDQDHELLNGDQSQAPSESADINPFTQVSQQLWNEDVQGADWPHQYSNQQLETEWDVINELRSDMAMLQQRVNHIQGMLEACMDMQIELHQELAAALNRNSVLQEN